MVDGDPKSLGSDAEEGWTGDELPGVGDRIALEVIAEGEIPQHLEEGVMPLGVADLLEIVVLSSGPNALLAGSGPEVVTLFLAQEDALELDHAGVGKQQVGSSAGTSDEEGTSRCPLEMKKSRKRRRIVPEFIRKI